MDLNPQGYGCQIAEEFGLKKSRLRRVFGFETQRGSKEGVQIFFRQSVSKVPKAN